MEDFIGPVAETGVGGFVLHWIISILVIYIAGSFIDGIRLNIFRYMGRHLEKSRAAGWVRGLDGEFR